MTKTAQVFEGAVLVVSDNELPGWFHVSQEKTLWT